AFARLRALPAGRGVAGAEGVHFIEARGAIARHAKTAGAARRFFDLDMRLRQFIEETRRHGRRPHAMDAAVRGEGDFGELARAGEADMGEATLFLEAGAAAFI